MKTVLKHPVDQRKVIRVCVPKEMGSSMMLRSQRLELLAVKRKAGEQKIPKNPFYLPRHAVVGSWLTKLAAPGGALREISKGAANLTIT